MAKGTTVTSGKQLQESVEADKAAAANAPEQETVETTVAAGGALVEATNTLPAEKFFAPSEIEEAAGAGHDNVKITDTLLPRIAIIQALSPQLKDKKIEYIPGAAVGDWCDVSIGEVFKGAIEVIPCHFCTQYIQWKKNRGGFAGNLGMDASCLNGTTLNDRRQHVLTTGDTIAETATWYVLLHVGFEWRRVFLPFSSTGLKISRKWMTLIRAERVLGKRGFFTPPLYYRPWILKSVMTSDGENDWYLPSPSKVQREEAEITPDNPENFKTIYHSMFDMEDNSKWLLREAQTFYADARDNLVVGDQGTDDPNNPENAMRTVGGSSIADNTQTM